MISKDTIALVRDRTDIVAVIAESVPSLKKRGATLRGSLPLPQGEDAKLPRQPGHGRLPLLRMQGERRRVSLSRARRGLHVRRGRTGLGGARRHLDRRGAAGAAPSDADRHKKEREALYGVMQMAAGFYEEQLREHPQRSYALDELARRELDPKNDAVQAFRVGYAPPGWDGLAAFLKKQSVSPAISESVGLTVPRSSGTGYYDRFRHRLMFAVVDVKGRVVAFSGRALAPLPEDDATRDPPPKYINSPESPIYVRGRRSSVYGRRGTRSAATSGRSWSRATSTW